ncbi:MAG: hypothetical protein WBX00_13530 [Isosphaeraceae bacterium]
MFHAVNRADHTQGFWNRPRQPDMAEMQYQVNNWYHFVWLSGDHIVEQHVHGIDACNWITRGAPVQATGVGGRRSGRARHQRNFRSPLRPVHLTRWLVQLQRVPAAIWLLVELQPPCPLDKGFC